MKSPLQQIQLQLQLPINEVVHTHSIPTSKQYSSRERWYHADLLQSLEVAARCIDDLNKIDQFHCPPYDTLLLKLYPTRRWQHLDHENHNHVGSKAQVNCVDLGYFELEHTKAALRELLAEFDKLRWYGWVNTDAFQKIICKIRSLGINGHHNALQVEESLDRLGFTTQAQWLGSLGNLLEALALISRAQQSILKGPPKAYDRFFNQLTKVNPSIPASRFWYAVEDDNSLELGRLIDNAYKGNLAFSRTDFLRVIFQCLIPSSQRSWVGTRSLRVNSTRALRYAKGILASTKSAEYRFNFIAGYIIRHSP